MHTPFPLSVVKCFNYLYRWLIVDVNGGLGNQLLMTVQVLENSNVKDYSIDIDINLMTFHRIEVGA
jgi:hypothetical protein